MKDERCDETNAAAKQKSVMGNSNKSGSVSYAIIDALSGAGRERFIVAYRSERSLHEFLVASCILGSGYFSREEAGRICDSVLPMAA